MDLRLKMENFAQSLQCELAHVEGNEFEIIGKPDAIKTFAVKFKTVATGYHSNVVTECDGSLSDLCFFKV